MFKLLIPIIFILGSIASFMFYTNETYKETKLQNSELQNISGALDKAAQLRAIRDKLAFERNSITTADLIRINKMLPDSVENIGLLIEMNNIARDKGMDLVNPSIAESSGVSDVGPDNTKYGSIKMTFGVNTTYEQFIDFLNTIENSLRIVDVMDISFGAPDDRLGRANFNLTIQTYWLK